MSELVPLYDVSCSLPKVTTEGVYYGEPQARLNFPDLQTAADFINLGLAGSRSPGSPVTVDYLQQVGEAPTGEHNHYDAFVWEDPEDNSTRMLVRRYGNPGLEAHAELSDFVVSTAKAMVAAELGAEL